MGKKILIMAGGTGGHVFPAIAIGRELQARGHEILWLGTRGRMEEKLVPKAGFPIEYINVRGIRRNGIKAKLTAPFMVMRAVLQALSVEKKFKPDVVLGMGGYASGPGGLAAKLLGIPIVLHEQNAAAGLTNRLLSKIASVILLGFPGAFSGSKVRTVGNPVRAEITALFYRKRSFNEGPLKLLVVGGSLGAQALNEIVPKACKLLSAEDIAITHQCGGGHLARTQRAYAGCNAKYEVTEFISDMAKAFTTHDLIICRAGASTVAEVACVGIPAIFVPLPSAVDDHQTKNASFLEKKGAALIMPQQALTAEKLASTLKDFALHRDKLADMSAKTFSCAITDATVHSADLIEELA